MLQIKPIRDDNNRIVAWKLLKKPGDIHNFATDFVYENLANGSFSMNRGIISMHTDGDDVKYRVIRGPGYYCCFDDVQLSGEDAAREYVVNNFAGQESPDKNNPSGYRKDSFFHCRLIEEVS